MAARSGGRIAEVVQDLCRDSAEFSGLWEGSDVSLHDEGSKRLDLGPAGVLTLAYCALGVEGRPDLKLVIHSPAAEHDAARIRALVGAQGGDHHGAAAPALPSRVAALPL